MHQESSTEHYATNSSGYAGIIYKLTFEVGLEEDSAETDLPLQNKQAYVQSGFINIYF